MSNYLGRSLGPLRAFYSLLLLRTTDPRCVLVCECLQLLTALLLVTDPHCSVNSLHLHVVDLSATGPSFGACADKNLEMDAVIEALQADIGAYEPQGQQASPVHCRRDSARSPNNGAAQHVERCAVVEMHRTDTEPQASRSTSVWC